MTNSEKLDRRDDLAHKKNLGGGLSTAEAEEFGQLKVWMDTPEGQAAIHADLADFAVLIRSAKTGKSTP